MLADPRPFLAQPTTVKDKPSACRKHTKHYLGVCGMRVYTTVNGVRHYEWRCASCGATGTDKRAK